MKEKLILLHGALGNEDQFSELKEIFSTVFDVYHFNFSGHGGLEIVEAFSIDLFVHNTLDFMRASGIESAHFFGYSMGGYVALQLAHDHPAHVKKIVTLGTKFNWTPESAIKEVRMMNPDIIEQKVPNFAASLKERHFPMDWKINMIYSAAMMTSLGNGAALKSNDFQAIENEVLVCIGTEDKMVTLEESAEVSGYLQHGTLKVIEGFNHPIESVDKIVLAEICSSYFTNKVY